MNATTPNRVEHQLTDKGYVPVYTTAVVEQPWSSYSATDHEVWATLFERQQQILVGPRQRRVPAQPARDGHGARPHPEVRRPQPRAARRPPAGS